MAIQILEPRLPPKRGERFKQTMQDVQQGAERYKHYTDKAQMAESLKGQGFPEGYENMPAAAQQAIANKLFASEKPKTEMDILKEKLAQEKLNYYQSNNEMVNEMMGKALGKEQPSFQDRIMQGGQESTEESPNQFDLKTGKYAPVEPKKSSKPVEETQSYNAQDASTWSKQQVSERRKLRGNKDPRLSVLGQQAEDEYQEREKKVKEAKEETLRQQKEQKEEDKLIREVGEKEEKSIEDSYKMHKPYIDEVRKSYKGTKEEEMHLNVLENLRKKGKLTTPLMYSMLGKLGIPLGVLNNPGSELFEKTGIDLTKNVKDFYGSRPTNLDVSLYLRSIPTLENSDEGKQLVINGIRLFKEPKKLEHQIVKDLLKKYEGKKLPLNFEGEVQEQMESKYDEIMSRIKDLARQPVAPGTTLDQNSIDKYLEISGGDPKEAERMAKEDGYSW